MALIKYSALVQEMRNKLNGSVASRNRYGNYLRNKTTPVNPQTSHQQNQRARLSSVSQAWAGLTTAQRSSFTDLASLHPYRNVLGDQYHLDGKAMFTKLNTNLLVAGQPMISQAVPFVEVPFVRIDSGQAVVDNGSWDALLVYTEPLTVPVGFTAVLAATEPLPATINFVKNRFRVLGTVVPDNGEIDLAISYGERFPVDPSTAVGKRIAFRLYLISNTTGQASLASELFVPIISA